MKTLERCTRAHTPPFFMGFIAVSVLGAGAPRSMYRAAQRAQSEVAARTMRHATSLVDDESMTCARELYRSRMEQSCPA